MKAIIIIFILSVLNVFADELYTSDKVMTMELQFYDANYMELLMRNKEKEIDIPAKLIVNDTIIFDSVGVRYKGNSSYNIPNKKKPFNISIDSYNQGQRLFGFKTINLNNGFVDPTFMREMLATEIFGNYLPTIKAGYVYLYINGNEYGLYSNMQQLNKDFLGQWYSSKSGNLYKGDPHGSLKFLGSLPENYKRDYEKKTNEEEDDWDDLIQLIDVINNSSDLEKELPEVFNTDRALWYFALCNAFVNLDSYIFSAHNYYLYNKPPTDIFDIIPWDMNEIFGVFPPRLSFPKENYPPVDLRAVDKTPLQKNMLEKDSYRKIYYAHYRTIVKEFFNGDTIKSMIERIKPVIENYVKRDPLKLYTYEDFINNITQDVSANGRLVPGLLSFASKRKDFLSTLPEFSQPEAEIENVVCLSKELIPGEDAVFNVSITGNGISNVKLYYKYDSRNFRSIEMFDDGIHSDREANDNVFGVEINLPRETASKLIEFYATVTDNKGMLSFFPERAEFVVLSKEIIQTAKQNDVAINEFMASNTKTIKDLQGSFADWIELHNISDNDIKLAHWYLTDDPAEKTKWQFPDVTIHAHDYLLIWADKDVEDEGLHTNFKLSKSGEYLGLYDNNGKLIDEYTFGEQTSDVSEGRYPNGTGDFVFMDLPTPMAENKLYSGIDEIDKADILIIPNPATDYLRVISGFVIDELQIFDLLGNRVLRTNNTQYIDISGLSAGIYIVRIMFNNNVTTKKMCIAR